MMASAWRWNRNLLQTRSRQHARLIRPTRSRIMGTMCRSLIGVLVLGLGCASSKKQLNDPNGPGGAGADGSGGGVPSLLRPSDGVRLKVLWFDGSSEQRTFAIWYDSALKTECSFRKAVDGQSRCLPFNFFTAPAPSTDFADPACTVGVVVYTNATCNPPDFIRRFEGSTACELRERIYARGERLAGNRPYWRPSGPAGPCAPGGILDTSAAFLLGPEMPPEMFVRGRDQPPVSTPTSAAIVPITFESEDGARAHTGWRIAATGRACAVLRLEDGQSHCLPQPAASLAPGVFRDGACTDPAAYFNPACSPDTPSILLKPADGVCPTTYTALALGPTVDPAYYRNGNGVCGPNAALVSGSHSVGLALPTHDFPVVDQDREPVSSRLRRVFVGPSSGQRIVAGGWYDAERDEICGPSPFGTKYRCTPASSVGLGSLFSDAQCARPLLQTPAASCPPRFAIGVDRTVCPPSSQVFAVGAPFEGPTFTLETVRSDLEAHLECRPRDSPSPAGKVTYTVARLPDEQFAEVHQTAPP
jgi:hypothetical protein